MKIVRKQYKNFFINELELEEEDYKKYDFVEIENKKLSPFDRTHKGRILEFSLLGTVLRFFGKKTKVIWYGKRIGKNIDVLVETDKHNIMVECKNWNNNTRLSRKKIKELVLNRFLGFDDDFKKNIKVLVYSGGKIGKEIKQYLNDLGIILIEINEVRHYKIILEFANFIKEILENEEDLKLFLEKYKRKDRTSPPLRIRMWIVRIRMWIARQVEAPPPPPEWLLWWWC